MNTAWWVKGFLQARRSARVLGKDASNSTTSLASYEFLLCDVKGSLLHHRAKYHLTLVILISILLGHTRKSRPKYS